MITDLKVRFFIIIFFLLSPNAWGLCTCTYTDGCNTHTGPCDENRNPVHGVYTSTSLYCPGAEIKWELTAIDCTKENPALDFIYDETIETIILDFPSESGIEAFTLLKEIYCSKTKFAKYLVEKYHITSDTVKCEENK